MELGIIYKRIWKNSAIILGILVSASQCTKKADYSQKTLKRQVKINRQASEEAFLHFFWEELSRPSFLSSPNMHWSCVDREQSLIIEWSRQKTLCKELVYLNSKNDPECIHEKKLKLPIEHCKKSSIESILNNFRFSPIDALFQNSPFPLIPNPSIQLEKKWHLPELIASQEGHDLEIPQLAEWMAASQDNNIISVNFQNLNPLNHSHWQNFIRWYSLLDGPLKLKFKSPPEIPESLTKLSSLNVFPQIIYKQKFPLAAELCSYLKDWITSRWILQGKKIETSSKIEIECTLDYLALGNPDSLEVTRVPIPLISVNDRLFPFSRRENILDPNVWNTLGALKP